MVDLKKILFVIFAIFSGKSLVFTMDQGQIQHGQNLNEAFFKEVKQIDRLIEILQNINFAVNSGWIKFSASKKVTLKNWLLDVQKNLTEIRNFPENFELDQAIIFNVKYAKNSTIIALNKLLKSNFKELPQINFYPRKDIATNDDRVSEQNLDVTLNEIANNVNMIGLSPINKFFRHCEKYNEKHRLVNKAKVGAIFSLVGLTFLYAMPENKVPEFLMPLKRMVGKKQYQNVNNNITTNYSGLFGTAEHELMNFLNIIKEYQLLGGALIASHQQQITNLVFGVEKGFLKSVGQKFKSIYGYLKGDNSFSRSSEYEIVDSFTLESKTLIGLEDAKRGLQDIVKYMKSPDLYDRSKTYVSKGILITGPSGGGKTLLVKALCGSINKIRAQNGQIKVGFKEVKWSDIHYVDDPLKQLIEDAKKNAPCVLFIDEIHLLGLKTDSTSFGSNRNLNDFLTGLSGLENTYETSSPVIIVAATNRPDLLDQALSRPGRFGMNIEVRLPSFKERREYFEVMFQEFGINAENIDFDEIAKQTSGCTPAQLNSILNNARLKARNEGKGITNFSQLQDSINSEVRKILSLEKDETNHLKNSIVSAHLAGQALVYLLNDSKYKISEVTIRPILRKIKESTKDSKSYVNQKRIKYGKVFTYSEPSKADCESKEDTLVKAKALLAGKLAQKLILQNEYDYKKNDKSKALKLIKDIVYEGMTKQDLPKKAIEKFDLQALEMISKFEDEIKNLLTQNKNLLNKIYDHLKVEQSLDGQKLASLMQNREG